MSQEKQKTIPETGEKLKILCFHGYRQNSEVFRQKTGSLRKMLSKWAEFYYIRAPHKVITVDTENSILKINERHPPPTDEYGWFFNRDDRTFRGIRKGGPAIGFQESLDVVDEVVDEHGPFDGVLGFSQGGCFVGLLCDLQQRNLIKYEFKFVMLFGAFRSNSMPHMKYYADPIDIPSLHVFGENDNIIPKEMSEELSKCFQSPEVAVHKGGHFVAANAELKPTFQAFVKERFLEKNSKKHQN